ncbi:MAG TPA: TerB family tellurite resistance protein [Spirochaetota bacterium]|nr:TerB family tellurite resistance protein [Spirochaetota bacterium]
MTKDLAIAHLLANFSYIDGEISNSEVKKIKEITKKMNIQVDIDTLISEILSKINDEEIKEYGESLAYLNLNLSEDEKIKVLKGAVEVIEADGKIMDKEIFKLHFVATNWGIEVKKVLSR